jgi:4-amino-4-deoxy-L-arabinose transferase-like glycosyltransferase
MTIAQNILDGKGFSFDEWGRAPLQPTSFLTPGYILWCVFWMWISPFNYLPMYAAQAVIAATGAIPAYLVGRRLFSERTGWIFAVAYTFYPEFVYLHSRPVAESLYVVFVLWMLHFYLRLSDESPGSRAAIRWSILLGLLSGIAMLVKEGAVVAAGIIGLLLLWRARTSVRALASHVVPFGATLLLVMSPWMIRNTVINGHFVPIRNGYGITLWLGNHHGATGTDKMPDGSYVLKYMPQYLEGYEAFNRSLPPDEYRRDLAYRADARKFMARYPLEYASLCAKRLWYFVWFDPTHPIARSLVYRLGYILLLALAIPGAIFAWRRKTLDPILPLIYLGYLALYVPVLVLPRYRIIPILLLLMMASYAVDCFIQMRTRQRADVGRQVR